MFGLAWRSFFISFAIHDLTISQNLFLGRQFLCTLYRHLLCSWDKGFKFVWKILEHRHFVLRNWFMIGFDDAVKVFEKKVWIQGLKLILTLLLLGQMEFGYLKGLVEHRRVTHFRNFENYFQIYFDLIHSNLIG